MKVHLRALGCRLNEAELEQWSRSFQSHGHAIIPAADDADLLILNTCAVTNDASRKSRNLINRLNRDNPTAPLVITGCHASLDPEEVAETHGVDLVISNDKKASLPDIVAEKFIPDVMPLRATAPQDIEVFDHHRQRAFIKIQDGCRYRCAFCIVTHARGNEVSRTEAEIVDEINVLHSEGMQEAVITGVHVGGYGSDIDSDLFRLVKRILSDTDIPRLRFASVEPWDLGDDFFSLFENPRLMPHMHLPLQSGSDSVLKRMSRRCKTEDFAELVKTARNSHAAFNVTTDLIAGFPGETETEWRETMDFVEKVGFSHLHIFPYSPRRGTKAADMPDQISHTVKKERCQELARLAETMKKAALSAALDQTSSVLWESPKSSSQAGYRRYHGYTENYLPAEIVVTDDIDLQSKIVPVNFSKINDASMRLVAKLPI